MEQKLITREWNDFYTKKNIEALEQVGMQELCKDLTQVEEKKIPIDRNLILQGVKNPLITIYVGFSTRTLFDAMKRKKKLVKYTCIIEPSMEAFKHLIRTEDISDLILSDNVDIIVGDQSERLVNIMFMKLVSPLKSEGMSISTMMDSMECIVDPFQYSKDNMEEANKIAEYIDVAKRQVTLSMGCSSDQFSRFELMIKNINNMFASWNISNCFDKFKDMPTFVLGGGPSLETFIEEYKKNEVYQNGLIIAVDAVLHKLLENGIKPHIVTRCERKLTNIFKGVSKENTEGIYYAAYPWTPPEFFELFEDSFYLFRQNGVCRFTGVSHGNVDGGVSSGNAALELAFRLGSKNIILSGLDLCMKDGQTHVGGTQVEFDINKSKAKWTKIKTNSGKEETTIPVWVRCLNEYAQSIDKHSDKKVKIFNIAYDGAVIPFTEYKPLKELAKLFKNKYDISEILRKNRRKIDDSEKEKFKEILVKAIADLKEFKTEIKICDGLADDGASVANEEIDKMMRIISRDNSTDGYGKICAIRQNQHNFDKLWKNVSDQYELNFRGKFYPKALFNTLIIDVLQLDTYKYENQLARLHNTTTFQDERSFNLYKITQGYTEKVLYYIEKFIELFNKAD